MNSLGGIMQSPQVAVVLAENCHQALRTKTTNALAFRRDG
jgi:hypothetical protein